MIKLHKTIVIILLKVLLAISVQAVRSPDTYKKKIKESEIKATAKIISVKVLKTMDYKISKEVEFELIQSYGRKVAPKTFTGQCYSSGKKAITGGDVYFYPEMGNKVFVTISIGKEKTNRIRGIITSQTPLTVKLEKALRVKGLSGIEYGIGKVYAKDN